MSDHLGVWTIKAPADMPIVQVTMLQATIREAWADYVRDGGDPGNSEEFWMFLTDPTYVPKSRT